MRRSGDNNIISQSLRKAAKDDNWQKITRFVKYFEEGNRDIMRSRYKWDMEFSTFEAVKHGKLDDLKYFMDIGVNPNVKNKEWLPLLLYAVQRGEVEKITLLLERGAGIHETDSIEIGYCIMPRAYLIKQRLLACYNVTTQVLC